jgi:hypothetical protein
VRGRLLTATPRGKSAEHLDVLVGLALRDEAMIRERLNTREAGDLMDELNAHRLRVDCGPHLAGVRREREHRGIETHVGEGSLSRSRFEAMKAALCAGELPVLCLSQIIHGATTPRTPRRSRTSSCRGYRRARAARPTRRPARRCSRSRADVHSLHQARRIEHVVSVVARRSAEHQILDSFEGVRAAESTLAAQLAAITGEIPASKDDAGYAGTAARRERFQGVGRVSVVRPSVSLQQPRAKAAARQPARESASRSSRSRGCRAQTEGVASGVVPGAIPAL